MDTKKANLNFLILYNSGRVWEYHFFCPLCNKHSRVPTDHSPTLIPCGHCDALLDGTQAKVELRTEPPSESKMAAG